MHYFIAILMSWCALVSASDRFFILPTDFDWSNLTHVSIAGLSLRSSNDIDHAKLPICTCLYQPGIPVEFWEPVKIIEVTTEPYHFPFLLGIKAGGLIDSLRKRGTHGKSASYYYHIYHVPFLSVFKLVHKKLAQCFDKRTFGIDYISENDWTHFNEAGAALLTPELTALLTADNKASIGNSLSCAADCLSCRHYSEPAPIDKLYFCGGCEGTLLPLTGSIPVNKGHIRNSYMIAMRGLFKLHRQSFYTKEKLGSLSKEAQCDLCDQVTWRRRQYKLQLLYPRPSSYLTLFPGQPIPYKFNVLNENFKFAVWLVWRKRYCCGIAITKDDLKDVNKFLSKKTNSEEQQNFSSDMIPMLS